MSTVTATSLSIGACRLARYGPRRGWQSSCCSQTPRTYGLDKSAGIAGLVRKSIVTAPPRLAVASCASIAATAARDPLKQHPIAKKKRQPALLRLDSGSPLLPSLTPTASNDSHGRNPNSKGRQAQRLARLHTALQGGSADAVWSAYLDLQRAINGSRSAASITNTACDPVLTPNECAAVVKVVSGQVTKTRSGLNRLLRLFSDVRSQQHRLLTQIQHAHDARNFSRIRLLERDLQKWDRAISPVVLNKAVNHIGRSLRTVGLEEIDSILDQLLTHEANEHSRRTASSHGEASSTTSIDPHPSIVLQDLRAAVLSPATHGKPRQRPGRQPESHFPDLATYNAILDIVTRTVHRSKANDASASKRDQSYEEEDDDEITKYAGQQLDWRATQLNASLTSRLRRFHLDPDAASPHLEELERADRLFHSVLERMQRRSRFEPDAITFNIMITMYCILNRWDDVYRVVRSAETNGALNIEIINNVLSHWVVRGPASITRRCTSSDAPASATDSALEVYRQLRQNLVRLELASQGLTIAYGREKHGFEGQSVRRDDSSLDSFGPLSWPNENETTSSSSFPTSSIASENHAVEALLGLPHLPAHLTPDKITYALMINTLTRVGRFADAFSVLKDLVSTPTKQCAKDANQNGTPRIDDSLDAPEKSMQPTLAMFVSFFRGFSRYGRPSTAITFDSDSPESSTWEPVPQIAPDAAEEGGASEGLQQTQETAMHAQQLELWSIDTFQEIFEAFINLEPDAAQALRARETDAARGSLYPQVSTPFGWITLAEKRRLDAVRRSPSSDELFWVLTAIRRVSNDHAEWSLAMWQRVVDKFSSKETPSSHRLTWTGFRLDNRLRRVVDHLETRLLQDEQGEETSLT